MNAPVWPHSLKKTIVGLLCLGWIAVASAPAGPTRDGKAGRGKGLFIKTTSRGTQLDPRAMEAVRNSPEIAGAQVTIGWSQLEPKKGEFNWAPIDNVLNEVGKAGKQVGFMFGAVGGKVATESQARKGKGRSRDGGGDKSENDITPDWLFQQKDVRFVGGFESDGERIPKYPLFWDKGYQKNLEEFIAAFAKRYDGDPRIEYIRIGGWQIGTNEPSFYGGATSALRDQLEKEGEHIEGRRKPRLSADSKYAGAVRDLMDAWARHFHKTRLAATVHFPREGGGRRGGGDESFEAAMIEHAAKLGFTLLNTGLNEGERNGGRAQFRQYADKYNVKVGWGGITHIGKHSSEDEQSEMAGGLRGETFRQGIGSDTDANYKPASRASYIVFGPEMMQYKEAVQWAAEHVVD